MNGQGIVLTLLLLWGAFNIFVLITKYRNPEKIVRSYTLGAVIFGIFISVLLMIAQIYLAAN